MTESNTLIIEAGTTERHYWRDLWRYRELFLVLAWRDISVRYKQTAIGFAWALIQPLVTMIIFTVLFGQVANLPTEGSAPYALLVYSGLLPWQLFSSSLTGASGSLIGNANLISKVYFPRIIIPASTVMVCCVDFAISLTILFGLMAWYKFIPGWQFLSIPFFVIMTFLASMGPGLLMASLNVKYRDFRIIIPFLVQLGLYISPIGFSSSIIPEKWKILYYLNPIAGIIDGFRWAILAGESKFNTTGFFISFTIVNLLLWIGISQFRKMEKNFADLV